MTTFLWIAAGGLLLNILCGLVFITRRRGGMESVLAVLLLGTTGVAITLVLGAAVNLDRAVDVALVFALLAAVLGITSTRRFLGTRDNREDANP